MTNNQHFVTTTNTQQQHLIVDESQQHSITDGMLKPNATVWRKVMFYVFQAPLFYLYLKGPDLSINGNAKIGFWSGQNFHDICSQLTNVASDHWKQNSELCDELIQRRFMTYYIFLETLVYIILTFSTLRYILKYAAIYLCLIIKWILFTLIPTTCNFILYRLMYRNLNPIHYSNNTNTG